MKLHKCVGCIHSGEYQEPKFMTEGVCKRALDLVEGIKAYNAEKCPYKKTNFDRITESEESLAGFIRKLSEECQHHNCLWCTLRDCNCCDIDCIKEWLQKEIEEGESIV